MSIERKVRLCGWACVLIGVTLLRIIQVSETRAPLIERRLQAVEAEQLKTIKDLNRFADVLLKQRGFTTDVVVTNLLPSAFTNLTVTNRSEFWVLAFSNRLDGIDGPIFVERLKGDRVTGRYAIDYSTNYAERKLP